MQATQARPRSMPPSASPHRPCRPQLEEFADRHGLRIGTIADLIAYRALHDQTIARGHEKPIDTAHGPFRLVTYADQIDGALHFALIAGEIDPEQPALVRVHVINTLRDLFLAERPGKAKSWSLAASLARIAAEGNGVLVNRAAFNALDKPTQDALLKAAADAETRGWKVSMEKNGWYLDQLKARGMSIIKPNPQFAAELKKIGDVMVADWLKKAGPEGQAIVDAYRK